MSNHAEDFRYQMMQKCDEQDMCEYCPYYYKYLKNSVVLDGCFNQDLSRYITWQEAKHG